MAIELVYETHSISEDNVEGIATGWLDGKLSVTGRELAKELGARRRDDGIAAVFTSDLGRAVETATIAFDGTDMPVLRDWRLRECDYGELNGVKHEAQGERLNYLDVPYPGGESWWQATARVLRFLDDLPLRWEGMRVLVIAHASARFAFAHRFAGVPLEEAVKNDFAWQEGWEYTLTT